MACPSMSVNSKNHGRLNEYFAVIELEQNPLIPVHEKCHGGPELRGCHSYASTENVSPSSVQSAYSIHPMQARYRSRVASRFPLVDHDDNHFPVNLALFCLPGGAVLKTEISAPIFFTFVHTRGSGDKMYGYCLVIYEELENRARAHLQNAIEEYRRCPHDSMHPLNKKQSLLESRKVSMYNYPFDRSEDVMSIDSKVYAPKCLCLLSYWPHFKQYREWLTGLYRISLSCTFTPLERYICNFMLEVPNAECLDINNILIFFVAILLERSVIIKSYHYSLLTACAEVVMALVFPLIWTHVYIPVLPESLLGVLGAPMPYLVGVHSSFLGENNNQDGGVPSHAIVIDLDKNTVDFRDSPFLLNLPRKRREKLVATLLAIGDFSLWHSSSHVRESLLAESDSAFCMPMKPCDIDNVFSSEPNEIEEKPNWERVTEAFLRVFASFLRGYRQYLVFPAEKNPSPIHLFREKDFLEGKNTNCRPFIAALIETQAFHTFVLARVNDPEGEDPDVILFDEAVHAKFNRSNRGLFTRKKSYRDIIQSSFNQAKTIVALTPDTSGLDKLVLNNNSQVNGHLSHFEELNRNRFPKLKVELYSLPRAVAFTKPPRPKFSSHSRRRNGSRNRHSSLLSRFSRDRKGDDERTEDTSFLPPQLGSLDSTALAIFVIGSMSTVGHLPLQDGSNSSLMISSANVSKPELQAAATAAPSPSPRKRRHKKKHSKKSSLDDPLNGGGVESGQKSSPIDQINHPDGPAPAKSKSKQSGMAIFPDAGGEENGRLLNASRLFHFAGTSMLYGSYCTVLMETAKKGRTMNQDGKKQWDEELTTFQKAVCKCIAQKWEDSTTSKETLLSATSMHKREPDIGSSAPASRSSIVPMGGDDLNDELNEAAQGLLNMTYDVLRFYRNTGLKVDKSVYLAITDATGRCGASEEAIAIAEMMMEDGIMPDAATNRCLIEACANDPEFDAMHAFDVLDWGKYRKPDSNNNVDHPSTRSRGDEQLPWRESGATGAIQRFIVNRGPISQSKRKPSPCASSKPSSSFFGTKTYCATEEQQLAYLPSSYKMHLQISDLLLGYIFPGLEIDADGETCPSCQRAMSCQEILNGWEPDVNMYTTKCPGKGRNAAITTPQQQRTCDKKFVARFKVMCSDPGWIGSTGVGSPLYYGTDQNFYALRHFVHSLKVLK